MREEDDTAGAVATWPKVDVKVAEEAKKTPGGTREECAGFKGKVTQENFTPEE